MKQLVAPFPYFGGKRRIAAEVWRRFGAVDNYVEPFFGSGAVLLGRPNEPQTETVNDIDGMLCNFWRAVRAAPDEVAHHADWPVSEADLHARHYWLVTEGAARIKAILGDPDAFDAKVAGWWCWGACLHIGDAWCAGTGSWQWDRNDGWRKGGAPGVSRGIAAIGVGYRGGPPAARGLTALAGRADREQFIGEWMHRLRRRLREVRICCGEWSRICKPSLAAHHRGFTGIFLDPPYGSARAIRYTHDDGCIAQNVRTWAIDAGTDPRLRIALCGYWGEHDMPSAWSAFRWQTHGGYGNQASGRGRDNAALETVWFSPACLPADAPALNLVGADA